jgi:long-subunit acyl-CoA synthetase (AMP-forming)
MRGTLVMREVPMVRAPHLGPLMKTASTLNLKSRAYTLTPLYDTLGKENLEYCLNESRITTLFVSS